MVRDTATGDVESLKIPGAFIFVGLDPNTQFLGGSAVQLDEYGLIITGQALVHDGVRPPGFESSDPAMLETSMPGIFAAGDVRATSTKQVATAAGEGATAALSVSDYLKEV